MRIIAGKFKGHKLVSFAADHIRPTTDRVKESLFNKLMNHWDGAKVLDLFSGTGNLAIEALSRGAGTVVAVESSKKSLAIMSQNLRKLGIIGEVIVRPQDVFKFLAQYDGEPFDVILMDPPFTEKIAHEAMVAASRSRVLRDGSIVVVESGGKERIDDEYDRLQLMDRRAYGDKTLSFFTCRQSG